MTRAIGCVGAIVVGALVLAGCSRGTDRSDAPASEITVFGPYRDAEADHLADVLDEFTAQTGIAVKYTGTADFVSDLTQRLGEGSERPDVAIVPQPGLVRQLVADDQVIELADVTRTALGENYSDQAQALGSVDGVPYGVPIRLDVKSLVWYRVDLFDERGWTVPGTLAELEELAAQIADDPDLAPWCMALRAGSATGWPATDWVEDLVLRRQGPETYRSWTEGTVPFASGGIRTAFEEFSSLVLAPRRLSGSVASAVETPTNEVFEKMVGETPTCVMVKQGDFARAWLPSDVEVGPDGTVDTFVLPDVTDAEGEPPLVVGADVAIALTESAAIDALMAYLAGPDAGRTWVEAGGFISPKSSIPIDAYPTDFARLLAEHVLDADELALDASDSMPPSVGTTLYWSEITSWLSGSTTYEQMATTLDDAFAATRE